MKVSKHQAEAYHVSNGYDGACIFLRHGPRDDGGSWGYISIVGSFGEFGYYFGNCAHDFKSFLAGCDHGYLTNKFFGTEARVFDCQKTVIELKRFIIERRRSSRVSKEIAREMFDSVKEADGHNSEEAFWISVSDMPRFYDWEIYDKGVRLTNPQAVGFFGDIWPGFVAEIQSETQAVAA
jgi:hypothetical protein